MGRRKIEIKAIKDDRNRSVTFLKRKGGLFKKAHELSVLCSVDVAVFIFGSNKKLYEYSSTDMREMITRYTYHGGPNEHKGPADFNGGNDEDEDEEGDGTPPHGEPMEAQMIPPQFQGQAPFPHMRHHTPSASPPIPNGMPFPQHPGHPIQRAHTPQPQMGSRPASRQDIRRLGPNMGPQPVGPPGQQQPPVNGFAYMPNPAIYNPQHQPNMPPNMPHGLPPQAPQYSQYPPNHHPPHMQQYMDEQRRSMPPSYPPQQGPPGPGPQVSRISPSPPQPPTQQLPPQPPQISPPSQPQQMEPQQPPHPSPQTQHQPHPHSQPQPQPQSQSQPHAPQQQQQQQQQPPPPPPQPQENSMPAPTERRSESQERPQPPLLNTDSAIKKLPQRKQHSIFTPIDENRSILSQHLASFASDQSSGKAELNRPQLTEQIKMEPNRSQSVDVGAVSRTNGSTSSPPLPPRASTQSLNKTRNISVPSIPDPTFTPPSRTNSMKIGGGARPRLRVEIPDEPSDGGSATAESNSPRNSTDTQSQTTRRHASDSHSSGMVLPPPSPSAQTLLSAGATGPPNPFARPPPQQNNSNSMNIDTPVSALPSRFLNNEFLPSPSSFYPEWYSRGGSDSNTLPSPLNFATPVVGSGPSFLRDDNANGTKRKSPEISTGGPHEGPEAGNEPKRIRVDS
ncbi:Transcription factor RLM1 [Colletotrichum orbiculare MAFF 240422]|uniref:MADS-box MEF2 type transcription factor MIG1 n=1 Tax=Colletotrichum orbiculare (strain 104-T / ATCC 96160 / CBS 514.97 / LARS 414 / MAFF 240422) TaxID=1213857 RepID=N4V127_COLOR|nr:Transcription factor RLM1 [Colletotrichum orbiculare MAFF 240422]